ncbi:hypothetical protein LOTGIDRAFT_62841, partial [Lottia gigantea]
LDCVKLLVENGADIDIKDSMYNQTSLVMAACLNVPDLVKYFIENGADLTSCDSKKNTALHYLCKNPETKDSIDCIQRIVEKIKIANCLQIIDSQNVRSKTPLYFAVKSGNAQIVDILVEAGCDVTETRPNNTYTILSVAIFMKAILNPTSDIVAKLITAGSNVNASDVYGYTPLMQAASCKDLDSMKLLIQHGADIHSENCGGDGIVDYCLRYRYIERCERISAKDVLELVHKTGARLKIDDIAEKYVYDIMNNSDTDTLEYLISNGLDIHHIGKNNRNILHLLSRLDMNGFNKIKPYCDEADVNQQDTDGDTPLMFVVKIFPFHFLIDYFLERGADVNLRNKKGQTPLMIVADENDTEILQELIYAGADIIDSQNVRSKTPLYFAVKSGNAQIVDILVEAGCDADVNQQDTDGVTPLMCVKKFSFHFLINYFLERDADVNLRNKKGQTLLMIVADKNDTEILQELIYAGADVNIRSQDGRTAL